MEYSKYIVGEYSNYLSKGTRGASNALADSKCAKRKLPAPSCSPTGNPPNYRAMGDVRTFKLWILSDFFWGVLFLDFLSSLFELWSYAEQSQNSDRSTFYVTRRSHTIYNLKMNDVMNFFCINNLIRKECPWKFLPVLLLKDLCFGMGNNSIFTQLQD